MRSALFWLHLTAGVLAGAVILIMSVTGVALAYERQLVEWAERAAYYRDPGPGDPLPVEALVGRAKAAEGVDASSVALRSDPRAPVEVRGRNGRVYLDARTGEVLGRGFPRLEGALSSLRSWHRWLALTGDSRAVGRAITGAANLLFLFLVVSGMILWVPRRLTGQRLRAVLWFRGGLRAKARDFNWHNVLGIWSALPLVLIVASGVVISYRWAGDLVYRAFGEDPPARGGSPVAADGGAAPEWTQAIRSAAAATPGWRRITLTIPETDAGPLTVQVQSGWPGESRKNRTLQIGSTGDVVSASGFSDLTPGRRARSFLRFAHTGEFWGLPGQTIAGLVTLASVVLVWTGIALALRRLGGALRRRSPSAAAADATEAVVAREAA